MSLPLHLLRQFHAVAQAGGFSRAAARLHISQPAVSKAVSELEDRLGMTLLERGRGSLRLTEAGAILMTRAGEILAIERQAEDEMRALSGLHSGSLRIGASTTIASYHVPPVLAAFCTLYPRVAPRLISANTAEIARLLLAREIEVALVEGHVDDPQLRATLWRRDTMVVVCGAAHSLAGAAGPISAARLNAEMFITREAGSGTREAAEAVCAALGVVPAGSIEVSSTEAIKQMVAAGFGVAVVSGVAAADQIALGTLCRLEVERGQHGGVLARDLFRLDLPSRMPSAAARALLTMLG